MPKVDSRPATVDQPLKHSEEKVLEVARQYFCHFNQKAFDQVALLFDEQGELKPPFDSPLIGREAIAHYLNQKAQKMTAFPQEQQVVSAAGRHQVDVVGQVRAIAFKVNVSWQFVINDEGKIARARIELLASPGELLNLRSMG